MELKDRFFKEAPQAWAAYLQYAPCLQLKLYAFHSGVAEGQTYDRRVQSTIRQAKNGLVWVVREEKPDWREEVTASNSDYSFRLVRPSAEKPWILKELRRRISVKEPSRDVGGCLMLYSLWLPDLIKDPMFKPYDFSFVRVGATDLARVSFTYAKPNKVCVERPGYWNIESGSMVLDPDHDWVLRDFELIHSNSTGKVQRQLTLIEGSDGHPIVKRTTTRFQLMAAPGHERIVDAVHETFEDLGVSQDKFRLPAFGLLEPPVAAKFDSPFSDS